jgi:ribonuclease BN (tRNA processing enzyme)
MLPLHHDHHAPLPAWAASARIERRSRTPKDHHGPRSGPDLSAEGRPDSNRIRKDHDLGCCRYTTTTMSPMPASPASADHRRVGTEIERR